MYLEHTALHYEIFIMGKLYAVKAWDKYWRLTIIKEIKRVRITKQRPIWYRAVECICECWVIKWYELWSVVSWNTKSCWCYHKYIKTTHWLTTNQSKKTYNTLIWHYIYIAWWSMKSRCKSNKRYIAKWIKVCEEWFVFENFYNDMIWTRKKWLSLDRINNDWNYCKENCRRADRIQQPRRRNAADHE